MSFSCSAWETFAEGDKRIDRYKRFWRGLDPFRISSGTTIYHKYDKMNATFFLDGDVPFIPPKAALAAARTPTPRRLFFVSARREEGATEFTLSATNCSMTESRVEVAVECALGRDCRATRMRRSQANTRPDYSTPLDSAFRMGFIASTLPFAHVGDGGMSSYTERFLRDPTTPQLRRTGSHFVNMAAVPPAVFARRLAAVLNAWYQLTLVSDTAAYYNANPAPASAPAPVNNNNNNNNNSNNNSASGVGDAVYGFDFGQVTDDGWATLRQDVVEASCTLFCSRSATARLTHRVPVFAYDRAWLALLLASATVLLATGLAGSVLSWRTRVPDMLGYVASMTYNNRYLRLPNSRGGVLDAMQRARMLRDLRVSVGDVGGAAAGVGHVAFTSWEDVRALEKGRKYT
jgi:hypothetical protein